MTSRRHDDGSGRNMKTAALWVLHLIDDQFSTEERDVSRRQCLQAVRRGAARHCRLEGRQLGLGAACDEQLKISTTSGTLPLDEVY